MKRIIFLLSFFIFHQLSARSQNFHPTTDQKDSFSLALVKLLNNAPNEFFQLTGDSIRSSSLLGEEYKLNFCFPQSSMAIVCYQTISSAAYIEFHNFSNARSAMNDMINKIKRALRNQIFDPNEKDADQFPNDRMLYIMDEGGYYDNYIELMIGRTKSKNYLLAPENEDGSSGKEVLLMKISGGFAEYRRFINKIEAPEDKIDAAIKKMVISAESDFQDLNGEDDVFINGYIFKIYRQGSNYDAILGFTVKENEFETNWSFYQQVLRAALGSSYVYTPNAPKNTPFEVYISKMFEPNKPRVYLQKGDNDDILIKIESATSHAVKRNKE